MCVCMYVYIHIKQVLICSFYACTAEVPDSVRVSGLLTFLGGRFGCRTLTPWESEDSTRIFTQYQRGHHALPFGKPDFFRGQAGWRDRPDIRVTALVLKGSIRVLYYRGHIGFL